MVASLKATANAADPTGEKERYIIPPHLHDLQESELPENQRGLVMSEIAQFRERAAKREREKLNLERERGLAMGRNAALNSNTPKGPPNAPSGPKERTWGRGQGPAGSGPQGYNKPVGFVQAQNDATIESVKTDEQKEQDRKEARTRDENESFRDVSGV